MTAESMIRTHPNVRGKPSLPLVHCIDECFECAQACITCADACVAEPMVEQLGQCIRLDLDCAEICATTGTLASRRTGSNETVLRATLELCALACRTCAEECEKHAQQHEHCRICAEVCRRCQQACEQALPEVSGPAH